MSAKNSLRRTLAYGLLAGLLSAAPGAALAEHETPAEPEKVEEVVKDEAQKARRSFWDRMFGIFRGPVPVEEKPVAGDKPKSEQKAGRDADDERDDDGHGHGHDEDDEDDDDSHHKTDKGGKVDPATRGRKEGWIDGHPPGQHPDRAHGKSGKHKSGKHATDKHKGGKHRSGDHMPDDHMMDEHRSEHDMDDDDMAEHHKAGKDHADDYKSKKDKAEKHKRTGTN